jgi:dienelactone hydrolase
MDKTRIAVAGQSCGGIQAYTASLDPRIKATAIFNSGLINEVNKKHFPKLHAPVGYFLGGPTDIAYANVRISLFSPSISTPFSPSSPSSPKSLTEH